MSGTWRYTKELYRLRKEKIERVFADAKEKHGMRYTQYRGLAQVTNWVKLKFAAMNLKSWPPGNGRPVIRGRMAANEQVRGETHKTFRLFSRRVLCLQNQKPALA